MSRVGIDFKSIAGLVLIALALTALGGYFKYRAETLRRYDCYVWGFNHALCQDAPGIIVAYQRFERCPAHLKPVLECTDFPETENGMADARRYINGDPIPLPPGDRDYRTFHVWGK